MSPVHCPLITTLFASLITNFSLTLRFAVGNYHHGELERHGEPDLSLSLKRQESGFAIEDGGRLQHTLIKNFRTNLATDYLAPDCNESARSPMSGRVRSSHATGLYEVVVPITIGSNISTLRALRQLDNSSSALTRTYERLSSGQRINHASDDPAGLAISESLNVKTHVYTQSIKNVSDGLSALSIAASAIDQLTEIVIRQEELAEQAANGTYQAKQRAALNNEFQALHAEYNRIVQTTTFNGQSLLDGREDSVTLQHGFGVANSTKVDVGQEVTTAAGDGTFTASSTLAISLPYSVSSGDIDNDGDIDLVGGGGAGGSVYLNQGQGTFTTGAAFASGSSIVLDSVLIDLNLDSNLDFVELNKDNTLQVHLGNGNGTFKAASSYSTGVGSGSYFGEIVAGDFNGDGRRDIAVSQDTPNTLITFFSNADGSLSRGPVITFAAAVNGLVAGDFTGDGVADIAASSGVTLSVWQGSIGGTFTLAATSATFSAGELAAGDLDNDGKLDLVSSTSGADTLESYLNVGGGRFRSSGSLSIFGSAGSKRPQLNDINGDSYLDVTAVSNSHDTLYIALGTGLGSFSAGVTHSFTNGINHTIADFDGDGIFDLAGASSGTNSLGVLRGNADSTGRRNPFQKSYSLLDIEGARDAIIGLAKLRESLGREQGALGTAQSRLAVVTNNLRTATVANQEARSRILNSDVAVDSAELARQDILQKSGAAILAQTNLQPQIALKLLIS